MSADQPLTGWRRRLSQLKSIAWTAFAMCSIGLAVVVGLGSALLPYADRFKPQVSQWLSARLQQPVSIAGLSARWEGNGPRLSLQGISVGDGSDRLLVDNAEVAFDTLAFVRPGGGVADFRVLVDDIVLHRDGNGSWGVLGLPGSPADNETQNPLKSLDVLQGMGIKAQNLTVRDDVEGWALQFGELELDLRNLGSTTRLAGTLTPSGAGRLELVLEAGRLGNRFYLVADALDLAAWQQRIPLMGVIATSGIVDGRLWGRFAGGRFTDLQWQGGVSGLTLMAPEPVADDAAQNGQQPIMVSNESGDPPPGNRTAAAGGRLPFALDLNNVDARFTRVDGGNWVWQLITGEVSTNGGTWPAVGLSVALRDSVLHIAADWLPLADLATLATVLEPVPESLRDLLDRARPQGTARNLQLALSKPEQNQELAMNGHVDVSSLGWNADGNLPGLEQLDLSVQFSNQRVTLEPASRTTTGPAASRPDRLVDSRSSDETSQATTLDLPNVFRWPLALTDLEGQIHIDWSSPWQVSSPALSFNNEGVKGSVRWLIQANEGKPFVDVSLKVSEGEVGDASRFWPHRKFNPQLVSWLDRSLLGGKVTGGSATLFGDLDDWPFRNSEGYFEARALVEDGRLDYHPEWPVADAINATLQFDNQGMSARARSGSLAGLGVTNVKFNLPRYRQPRAEFDGQSVAAGEEFLAFLERTPLFDTYKTYLEGLEIDGRAKAVARIEVPLKAGLPERLVDGVFTLQGADVTDEKWQVSFTDTRGDVRFTHEGLQAQTLATHWEGFPATMTLATGNFVSRPDLAAEAQLTGLAPARVFAAELPQLRPLLSRIPEACEWIASLEIGLDGQLANAGQPPRLTVRSQLAGSEVQLPAPLNKAPDAELPMTLGMDLPDFGNLNLDISDLIKLRFRPAAKGQPWGGTLHLGPGEPAVNVNPGLLIEGHLDFLDLDEWQDLLGEFSEAQVAGQLPDDQQRWLTSLDLKIDHLRFAYRDFHNLQLSTSRDDQYWTLALLGDEFDGTLRIPLDPTGRRLLLAELDRLEWPASTETLGPPTIHPASIPPLRFVAGNVSFDGVPYGSVSFESYPVRDGMHIDHLETQSDTMAISASGDWLQLGGQAESRFGLTITGNELGDIFEAFGYTRLIEGGQTIVRLDVNWPGGLSDFEMATLNGDMDVSISNGQIVEVDPGAGRIFGLMSLQALPRRLLLDFSDLFKTGLTFDSIQGNFKLEQGQAVTDNLAIKGPTADIEIKGRTGIADQNYDQVVTVIPEVGATLPIVGALAGGAGGAAAAFLLQNMFGRQIDKISQFHYSVTGSFESPEVELIGADDQRLELETARALRREAERQPG